MSHSLKDFTPDRVATLETQMWKAYYSHQFLRLTVLLLRLFKEQFHANLFVALQLGYYSGKAAAIFRKSGNQIETERFLKRYYRTLEQHAQESFDVPEAARLELAWWLIHRYPKKYAKSLATVLAESMAVLYDIAPTKLARYAEHRATAIGFRDEATHIDKIEPDWQKIQRELRLSYSELKDAIH